jgi:hypothetical protein
MNHYPEVITGIAGIHKSRSQSIQPAVTASLALTILILGFLATATDAYAGSRRSHSGAICKNYYPDDARDISHYPWGITSLKNADTYVICPIPRTTDNANGGYIDVIIEHTGEIFVEKTTTCTAVSLDYQGVALASETQTWTGTGLSSLSFNLSGAGRSDEWSTYSVLCVMPGFANGRIHGITLIEPPLP